MNARPLSAQELCESVRNGLPLDPARLDRVLAVDTNRGRAEVQSGVTWKRLAAQLRPGDAQAGAVRTTRATINDSLAWNAAGPDGRPCVRHVESFTMVTPDGQLRRIDRIRNSGLFALVVGGLGLFGALYSVTLRLESLARSVAEARPPQTMMNNASTGGRRVILLVPPARLDAMLAACHERCAEWRVDLQALEVRHIQAENETFLRWAGRDYAEVTLALGASGTLGAEVRQTQLRRSLIDIAIEHGGGFPIACTPEATRSQTEACYPQLPEFLAEQRRVDPQERWVNGWLRHQRRLLSGESLAVRWS